MKASVLRYAAIGMASLSMAGFAAASTVTLGTTGPDSNNQIDLKNKTAVTSTNTNVAGVGNFNAQGAATGDVTAHKNTSVGGSNGSGDAANTNTTTTTAVVTNSGSGAMLGALAGVGAAGGNHTITFDTTGPDSNNQVKVSDEKTVTSTNTNVVNVTNTNVQSATSGNVNVSKNTTAGGATSGDAHNMSNTTNTVTIGN